MTEQHPTASNSDPVVRDARLPAGLPQGSAVLEVAYVSEVTPGQEVLFAFPPPMRQYAVRVPGDSERAHEPPVRPEGLLLLSIPTTREGLENPDAKDLLDTVQAWVDAEPLDSRLTPAMRTMTLQGVRIICGRGRLAILASEDRLETARKALIEASFYEAELLDIEQTLGADWPQLDADLPLAFEFDTASIPQRKRLSRRYQEVLRLRTRLARMAPHVYLPHLHPPSLASQIGERFRERTRLAHRYEMLSEQVEVFESVYETCGQRASDFMLTRSGNTLEWVIIVLLLTQVLLWGFELLTTMGT